MESNVNLLNNENIELNLKKAQKNIFVNYLQIQYIYGRIAFVKTK